MINALVGEYRKHVSTRMWWVLLIAMGGYMAFLAAVMGIASSLPDAQADMYVMEDSPQSAIAVYTVAVSLGYVFPLMIGALSVTSEFRHRTITTTFLAEPRRGRVLLAKLISSVPLGFAYGFVGVLAGFAAGAGALSVAGYGTYVDHSEVWVALARSVLALVVWTMLGVGLGAAVPYQVAVVVGVLAFTQFVEPILRMALSAINGGAYSTIGSYFPGAAGEALAGSSVYATFAPGALLDWWQGLLVLMGYTAIAALIGRYGAFAQDIT